MKPAHEFKPPPSILDRAVRSLPPAQGCAVRIAVAAREAGLDEVALFRATARVGTEAAFRNAKSAALRALPRRILAECRAEGQFQGYDRTALLFDPPVSTWFNAYVTSPVHAADPVSDGDFARLIASIAERHRTPRADVERTVVAALEQYAHHLPFVQRLLAAGYSWWWIGYLPVKSQLTLKRSLTSRSAPLPAPVRALLAPAEPAVARAEAAVEAAADNAVPFVPPRAEARAIHGYVATLELHSQLERWEPPDRRFLLECLGLRAPFSRLYRDDLPPGFPGTLERLLTLLCAAQPAPAPRPGRTAAPSGGHPPLRQVRFP